MIFVTVGTYNFDELIGKIDAIANGFDEEIIGQIGNGEYIPKNYKFFRYAPSLNSYYDNARIIIGHGGAGTIFDILNRGKTFIGLSSPLVTDEHQIDLLDKLAKENYILWCKEIEQLGKHIELLKTIKLKRYEPPPCFMDKVIVDFLRK